MTFIGPSSQITAHLGDADGASTLLDWQPVAELHAPSGALLPCDGTRYHPSLAATAARLCVPTDRPLTLWLRFLAKGDQLTRVAGLRVTFEGTPMEQATLPRTGIDTASLLIADAGALEHRWRVGGPHNETLLYTASGSIPDALLDRIRAAGWPIRPGRFFPRFERPLEDEDLAAITAWLAEHAPEVSLNPVVHETAHRIERARGDRRWIPLVDDGTTWGLITSTGWGDGSYDWRALDPAAGVAGYEVDFIARHDVEGAPLLRALARRAEATRSQSVLGSLDGAERLVDDVQRLLTGIDRADGADSFALTPVGEGLRRYLADRASNRLAHVIDALREIGVPDLAEVLDAVVARFGAEGLPAVPATRAGALRTILAADPDALVDAHRALLDARARAEARLGEYALARLPELIVPAPHRAGAQVRRAGDVDFDVLRADPCWWPTGFHDYLYAHPNARPPGPTAGLVVAARCRLAGGGERPARMKLTNSLTGLPGYDARFTEAMMRLDDGTPCRFWRGSQGELPDDLVEALLGIDGAVFPVTLTVDADVCPRVPPLTLPGFFREKDGAVLSVVF